MPAAARREQLDRGLGKAGLPSGGEVLLAEEGAGVVGVERSRATRARRRPRAGWHPGPCSGGIGEAHRGRRTTRAPDGGQRALERPDEVRVAAQEGEQVLGLVAEEEEPPARAREARPRGRRSSSPPGRAAAARRPPRRAATRRRAGRRGSRESSSSGSSDPWRSQTTGTTGRAGVVAGEPLDLAQERGLADPPHARRSRAGRRAPPSTCREQAAPAVEAVAPHPLADDVRDRSLGPSLGRPPPRRRA